MQDSAVHNLYTPDWRLIYDMNTIDEDAAKIEEVSTEDELIEMMKKAGLARIPDDQQNVEISSDEITSLEDVDVENLVAQHDDPVPTPVFFSEEVDVQKDTTPEGLERKEVKKL